MVKRGGDPDPIHVRFGDALLSHGHTAVPNLVLKYADRAGITEGELLCTIHIWMFWWGAQKPYPSIGLIAAQMGKTPRQVRRYIESMEKKGVLTVHERFGGPRNIQLSHEFDFSPMLARIRELAATAGDLEPNRIEEHVRRRVRSRADKNVRAAVKSVTQGRTETSAEEYKDINTQGRRGHPAPNGAERYATGVYAVCPECGARPCTAECARQTLPAPA